MEEFEKRIQIEFGDIASLECSDFRNNIMDIVVDAKKEFPNKRELFEKGFIPTLTFYAKYCSDIHTWFEKWFGDAK